MCQLLDKKCSVCNTKDNTQSCVKLGEASDLLQC
jgi:hypothetical protein